MPEDLLNDDTALGMLRLEHARIDQLIASCLQSDEPEFTRQAMRPLMQELEIHSAMEHEFFFPLVDQITHNVGDRRFADDGEIESLKQRLEALDPADADYIPVLSELAAKFQRHCYLEEQFGFLPIEMNDPDTHNLLIATAQRMRERRESILTRTRERTNRQASAQARRQQVEAENGLTDSESVPANPVYLVDKEGHVVGERREDSFGALTNDVLSGATDEERLSAKNIEEAAAEAEAEDIGDLDNYDVES